MAKTIRFLGGPADKELLSVPDETVRVVVYELVSPFDNFVQPVDQEPPDSVTLSMNYHIYRQAFPGAAYFKYQGESLNEDGEPERPSFEIGDFFGRV